MRLIQPAVLCAVQKSLAAQVLMVTLAAIFAGVPLFLCGFC